jgi:replicative DNA helicase
MMLKMLAQKTGFSTSQIKRYSSLSPDERNIIIDGWKWLEELKKRFVLVDATAGNTPEVMEAHIEWFTKNYPDSKRLFCLDNFHKLRLPPGKQKADVIAALSEKVKELTQIYDIHIMQTVELRKMGESADRPSTSDLKDSVQLEYDADVIALVHNEMQVKPESTVCWKGQHPDEGTKNYPYLEVRLWKNKITGKTDDCAYKLDKYNLRINQVATGEIMTLRSKNIGSSKVTSAGKAY